MYLQITYNFYDAMHRNDEALSETDETEGK